MIPERIRSETTIFSNSVNMILARTGPSEHPIETPSICLNNWLLNEKVVLLQQSKISFFKVCLLKVVSIKFWL